MEPYKENINTFKGLIHYQLSKNSLKNAKYNIRAAIKSLEEENKSNINLYASKILLELYTEGEKKEIITRYKGDRS